MMMNLVANQQKIKTERNGNMAESPILNFQDLYRKHCSEETTTRFLELWHYTSADGLLGILRNEKSEHGKLHFWFTRSDCLNDTSEGTHILFLFRQVYHPTYCPLPYHRLLPYLSRQHRTNRRPAPRTL